MLRALTTRQATSSTRQLHTTPVRAVRRPQKPFEAYIPRDPTAKTQLGVDKRRRAQLDDLYIMAHEGRKSATEKYADTYGLRVPGVELKPSWEKMAEWREEKDRVFRGSGAKAGGTFGMRAPEQVASSPKKVATTPEVTAATPSPAGDAPPSDEDLKALRRKALQSSNLSTVLQKWRAGVDINAGIYSLRAKEREEEAAKARRNADRKAARRETKVDWNRAKSANNRDKLQVMRRQFAEAGRLRALGLSPFRSKQLSKDRWDMESMSVRLLADDVRYLGGPDDVELRREVWAEEKAAGRTTGPNPTPEQLGQPAPAEEEVKEGDEGQEEDGVKRRWEPTKRLTYAAMGGMRELRAQDPETWTPQALSHKFGISYDAVKRILRSSWNTTTDDKDVGKWSRAPDGVNSPVPHIRAVYELKRADEAAAAAAGGAGGPKKEAAQGNATGKGTGKGGRGKVGNWQGGQAAPRQPSSRQPASRKPALRQRGGFGIKE